MKKITLVVIICMLALAMGLTFGIIKFNFSDNLTTRIKSKTDIRIVNIDKKIMGEITSTEKIYDDDISLDIKFNNPGESIIYDIELLNNGDTNIFFDDVKVYIDNENIKYIVLEKPNELLKGKKNNIKIKVYSDISSNEDLSVKANIQLLFGQKKVI